MTSFVRSSRQPIAIRYGWIGHLRRVLVMASRKSSTREHLGSVLAYMGGATKMSVEHQHSSLNSDNGFEQTRTVLPYMTQHSSHDHLWFHHCSFTRSNNRGALNLPAVEIRDGLRAKCRVSVPSIDRPRFLRDWVTTGDTCAR